MIILYIYLLYPLNKKLAYKTYFCEICGHLLKNFLLFLHKFKYSEACILLNIDLGPMKSQ